MFELMCQSLFSNIKMSFNFGINIWKIVLNAFFIKKEERLLFDYRLGEDMELFIKISSETL